MLMINLEQLSKDWNSPIYVFFKPTPSIEYIKECRVHVFECKAKHCKGKGNSHMVQRYLDMGDAKSTSNLCKHPKVCWGEEMVVVADQTEMSTLLVRHWEKGRMGQLQRLLNN